MRYISLFSGIEAASCAWVPLGWEPVAFAEIEPFPCRLLRERFPDVPNLGDVRKVDWTPYRHEVDVIVGGSPCFVAGTPVVTSTGIIPIENVKVGDLVLTHLGRWRKVLATGFQTSNTIFLKGQGTSGLECTENHPFLSRKKWHRSTRVNGKPVCMKGVTDPEWTPASDMDHRCWFCPSEIEPLPVPEVSPSDFTYQTPGEGHLDNFKFSTEFFRFVGMWLGDGWANEHQRKNRKNSIMKRVYLCCAKGEESDLKPLLESTGLHWMRNEERTTFRFTCSSTQLYDWLVGNFGIHADGKTLPGWVFGMKRDWRDALFTGYMDTDGTVSGGVRRSVSINRNLTVGMKILASTLGLTSSVTKIRPMREKFIEGRKVNERPYYNQSYRSSGRSAFFKDGGWWGLVRSISPGSENVTVYNLEVDEDNSYTVDGIAVHNCQAYSIAGLRRGLADERGRLMLEYVRAVDEVAPPWVVWENVPGVLSQDGGRAFGTLLSLLGELGYGLCWRVLDAQHFGVPQRRKRVFLVGSLGDLRSAEVLFEPEGVPGRLAACEEAEQVAPDGALVRPDASGGMARPL